MVYITKEHHIIYQKTIIFIKQTLPFHSPHVYKLCTKNTHKLHHVSYVWRVSRLTWTSALSKVDKGTSGAAPSHAHDHWYSKHVLVTSALLCVAAPVQETSEKKNYQKWLPTHLALTDKVKIPNISIYHQLIFCSNVLLDSKGTQNSMPFIWGLKVHRHVHGSMLVYPVLSDMNQSMSWHHTCLRLV